MAFNLESARKDGATDSQIADYLAQKHNFRIADARNDGADDAQIIEHLMVKEGQPSATNATKSKERTWGEAATDIGAGLMQGGANLVGSVGAISGLVGGDQNNFLTRLGEDSAEHWEGKKSEGLKARIAERKAKIDAADGVGGKGWTALKETLTDPALALDVAASNVATLVPGAALGRAASIARYGILTKGGMASTEAAAKAGSFGSKVAIGTGATQQGGDVAHEAYKAALEVPDKVWDANPKFQALVKENGGDRDAAKAKIANQVARITFAPAATISTVANAIPGADYLERALVGKMASKAGLGGITGKAVAVGKGALGEGAQEAIEEGGGQLTGNLVNRAMVDPNQDVWEGVGESAGLGAAGGILMGGIAGLRHGGKDDSGQQIQPSPAQNGISGNPPSPNAPADGNPPPAPPSNGAAPANNNQPSGGNLSAPNSAGNPPSPPSGSVDLVALQDEADALVQNSLEAAAQAEEARAVGNAELAAQLEQESHLAAVQAQGAKDALQRESTGLRGVANRAATQGIAGAAPSIWQQAGQVPVNVTGITQPDALTSQSSVTEGQNAPAGDNAFLRQAGLSHMIDGVQPGLSPAPAQPALNPVTPKLVAPVADGNKSPILQNRDRSTAASIDQMNSIAASPDYLRTGPSRTMDQGAPVVFGDMPSNALIGREETIADGHGKRIKTQYAVVEADDVLASNAADGSPNKDYAQGVVGKVRPVAGNGRAAGLIEAYNRDTTASYRQELTEDAKSLGLDAEAVNSMRRPILVRMMSTSDVTADIGDRSNVQASAAMSPTEQANNDARRVDIAVLEFDDNGEPTRKTVLGFIHAMPVSERGSLLNKDGTPTRQAVDRLMAATFKQAYSNDELVSLYAQATDPEARAVMSALAQAAGEMAKLGTDSEIDIRSATAEAAIMAVNAVRRGRKLADMVAQQDISLSDDAFAVADFFARNIRSAKRMGEGLHLLAKTAAEQIAIKLTNEMQGGMFGEQPTLSREQLLGLLKDDQSNKKTAPRFSEGQHDKQAARGTGAESGRSGQAGRHDAGIRGQDSQEVLGNAGQARSEGFQLNQQTETELAAKAERESNAQAQEAAETKRTVDAASDSFSLSQGQGNAGKQVKPTTGVQKDLLATTPKTRGEAKAAAESTPADEFNLHSTLILSALNVSERNQLWRMAGKKSTSTFNSLPLVEQAKAYQNWVESGGRRIDVPKDNDAFVRAEYQNAENNRLQAEKIIRQANGKPYKTEAGALTKQEENNLGLTHKVVAVSGGFELHQLTPAEQVEAQRKAEGRESYIEAQQAVIEEMGLGENADGEIDATDAQWAKINRRVDARLRGGNTAQPKGTFGPVFTGYTNQPEAAIEKLMQEKRGEVPDAFTHPELGAIAFVYGDEKMGLRHIEAKRDNAFVRSIPDILRNGRVERDDKGLPRAYVVLDGNNADVAVIRLDWDGKDKTWLVTAYRDEEGKFNSKKESSGERSRVIPESPTHTKPPFLGAEVGAEQGNLTTATPTDPTGAYHHKHHQQVTAEVTKTEKGYQVEWSPDDVQEFKGKNAVANLAKAMEKEGYAKQNDTGAVQESVRHNDYHSEPSEAQKKAGNYKKEHVRWNGLDLAIETQAGTMRRGVDTKGKAWENQLAYDYGYFKRTEGADGDAVDVFIGNNLTSDKVFIVNQRNEKGGFDEHKIMLGFDNAKAAEDGYLANYSKGWNQYDPALIEMNAADLKDWLLNGDTKSPVEPPNTSQTKEPSDNQEQIFEGDQTKPAEIQDFGERLEGARKFMPPSLRDEVSDADLFNEPLSKIWPADAHESIEDNAMAALAFSARDAVPAKPRVAYKVKRWVERVKGLRELLSEPHVAQKMLSTTDSIHREIRALLEKARLLAQLPRDTWKRVDKVETYPSFLRLKSDEELLADGIVRVHKPTFGNSFFRADPKTGEATTDTIDTYGKGSEVLFKTDPHSVVVVDGKAHRLDSSKIGADEVQKIKELLGASAPEKGGLTTNSFEIRGNRAKNDFFIVRKGDSEYRKLATFNGEGAIDKVRAYIKNNVADLTQAWEDVKARDNVGKGDTRNDQNRTRVGKDRRNGKDTTEQMFADAFGFRGVQFGNWIAQGKGAKDRQGMLNEAFDALHDLADIIGVPTQALSLNGTLGLAFGARGSGKAAAHFERDTLVINLTKTKGAGSLAHEWFHALDNYFSRMRNEVGVKRKDSYITYRPESKWVKTDYSGKVLSDRYSVALTTAQLRDRLAKDPSYDPSKTLQENAKLQHWVKDPSHKEGVRPEVEAAFAKLVEALNASPMAKRATAMDKTADGYWSRIIERGARSFENYVISKMAQQGGMNDFLANIKNWEIWQKSGKNDERYPYLKPDEEAPIIKAFDDLFDTIETKEEDGKQVLYSRKRDIQSEEAEQASGMTKAALNRLLRAGAVGQGIAPLLESGKVVIHSSAPAGIAPDAEGWTDPSTGTVHLLAPNLTPQTAMATLLHEMFHRGKRQITHDAQYKRLMKELEKLFKQYRISPAGTATNTFWREAMDIVQINEANSSLERQVEEFGAYAITAFESAPRSLRKMMTQIAGMAKAWLLRTYGVQFGATTPAQLRAVALHVLKTDAKQTQQQTQVTEAVAYSRSTDTQTAYESRIDALFAGEKPNSLNGVMVLDRSDMLDLLGMGNAPLHLVENKVQRGQELHSLTANDWKKVPEWLENPAYVFDSDTVPGRLVFIAPETVNGRPVRMVVEPNTNGKGLNLLVNAYDAGGTSPMMRWAQDGLMRYIDERKTHGLSVTRLRLPRLADTRGSKRKIQTGADLFKYRQTNGNAPVYAKGKDAAYHDAIAGLKSLSSGTNTNDAFRYARSTSKDLSVIAETIDAKIKVSNGSDAEKAFARKETKKPVTRVTHLDMPRLENGKTVYDTVSVYETANEVWINASDLRAEVSGGTKAYTAVGDYAHNTGKTFIGDPLGLSDEAKIRRTENMLSLAFRHGTTRFMEPHPFQVAPAGDADSKLKNNAVRPLDWRKGDDRHNMVELVKTSLHHITQFAPEIKNVRYAPADGKFVWRSGEQSGKPVTPAEWNRLYQDYRAEVQGRINGQMAEKPRTDELAALSTSLNAASTLKRAAYLNTILSATTAESRQHLLRFQDFQNTGETGVGAGVASTDMAGVLYSRSRPNNNPSNNQPPSKWQQVMAKAKRLLPIDKDAFIYEWQDKLIDLKRIQERIKSLNGLVTDMNDAYMAADLFHKRLATRSKNFLKNEVTPLIQELKTRGVSVAELEQFLHARHAPEANKEMADRNPDQATIDAKRQALRTRVRQLELAKQTALANNTATHSIDKALNKAKAELNNWNGAQAFRGTAAERLSLSGMSDAEAALFMNNLTPEQKRDFDALAQMVDDIQQKTLDELVKYGLMDAASIAEWKKTYKHYIPLHRDEAHEGAGSHPIGQGFSTKGDASKQRVGSNEKVTNILGHIVMQREAALTRGEKNRVSLRLIMLAKQNPDPDIWEFKTPTMQRVDPKTGIVKTIVDPTYRNADNALFARANGKDIAVIFNERNPQAMRLAQSLKNADMENLGLIGQWVGKLTRYFAATNTQWNIVFGVVNLMRDTQALMLQLSDTPLAGKQAEVLKNIAPAIRAIYREQRGKGVKNPQMTAMWEAMQMAGGTTGFKDIATDPEGRQKALLAELKSLDRGNVSKLAHATAKWISDYNETLENATRLSAFKVAIESGMSAERAAELAKNVTVNFNRKGRTGAWAANYFAFLNAAIQGIARMVQTLNGPAGKKIIMAGVSLGAINAIIGIAMMAGGDDDDNKWDEIPDFVKENNLIIPLGREDYFTIPMPLGFNIFPNIGRKIVEMAMSDSLTKSKGSHVADMLAIVLNGFNPLGSSANLLQVPSPTILDPVVALATNEDWNGMPITRKSFNENDPTPGFKRSKDSASSISKALAEQINWITGGNEYSKGEFSPTPDQLDYVFGQITGGTGREINKATGFVDSLRTGEDVPAYKRPVISRFYGNTRGDNAGANAYYERSQAISAVEAEYKARDKQDALTDEFLKNPLLSLIDANKAADKEITALKKEMRAAAAEGDREMEREIKKQIGVVMSDFNRTFKQEENYYNNERKERTKPVMEN